MADKPLWRQAFDAVDKRVAPPLESLVQSGQFAELVSVAVRLQGGVQGFVERRSRQVWHLVNLPAGSDVLRLREQVVSLDREVRHLRTALEEAQHGQSDVATRHRRGNGGTGPSRGRAGRAASS